MAVTGDHPRMCGEHIDRIIVIPQDRGSSPHVRGARVCFCIAVALCGIIPACAGSTKLTSSKHCAIRDHPRMCGEHEAIGLYPSGRWGSSPHVRGARCGMFRSLTVRRIIPACAGSTLFWKTQIACYEDHPRMCGEHTSKIA